MSYLFYDLETSGLSSAYDQILQFAAIRTDDDFQEIGDPIEIFCRVRPDVLPTPTAISINCIDVHDLDAKGVCEFELARQIERVLLGDGNQCIVGYNSLEFDDEFVRFLLYRNLLDPYGWHWRGGNTRLDLFQVFGLGLSFDALGDISLDDGEGGISLRLENLARANGLEHEKAHDALSDVRVTVRLAQLLKGQSPKLVDHALNLRDRKEVSRIATTGDVYCHSKSFYTYERRFLMLHAHLCGVPGRNASLVSWKLNSDPTETLGLSADEVRKEMFAKGEDRKLNVGFHELRTNQVPMVTKFVESRCAHRVEDYEACSRNLELVKANRERLEELGREVFSSEVPKKELDADLYHADFFPDVDADEVVLRRFRLDPLGTDRVDFTRQRFKRQALRIIARNFPEALKDHEMEGYAEWLSRDRLGTNAEKDCCSWSTFESEVAAIATKKDLGDPQRSAIRSLCAFVDERHGRENCRS